MKKMTNKLIPPAMRLILLISMSSPFLSIANADHDSPSYINVWIEVGGGSGYGNTMYEHQYVTVCCGEPEELIARTSLLNPTKIDWYGATKVTSSSGYNASVVHNLNSPQYVTNTTGTTMSSKATLVAKNLVNDHSVYARAYSNDFSPFTNHHVKVTAVGTRFLHFDEGTSKWPTVAPTISWGTDIPYYWTRWEENETFDAKDRLAVPAASGTTWRLYKYTDSSRSSGSYVSGISSSTGVISFSGVDHGYYRVEAEDPGALQCVAKLDLDIFLAFDVEIGSGPNGPSEYRNRYVLRASDPARSWVHAQDLLDNSLVSHPSLGDYVEYKAYVDPLWVLEEISSYNWFAVPKGGYDLLTTIQGPSGPEESTWKIDGGGMNWSSGKYEIKLEITFSNGSSRTAEKEQIVWQGSDDVLLVNWIDQAEVQIPDGTSRVKKSNGLETTSSVGGLMHCSMRAIFLGDIRHGSTYTVPIQPPAARHYINAVLIHETPNDEPPLNFTKLGPGGGSIPDSGAIHTFANDPLNYRALTRFQAVHLLGPNGEIDLGPLLLVSDPRIGHTPDLPCVPNWLVDPAGEEGPNNAVINTSNGLYEFNDTQHSAGLPSGYAQYLQGRLGSEGQVMSGKINNRQVPWIWNIIEFDKDNGHQIKIVESEIFPTRWVYINGDLYSPKTKVQSSVENFINKGALN